MQAINILENSHALEEVMCSKGYSWKFRKSASVYVLGPTEILRPCVCGVCVRACKPTHLLPYISYNSSIDHKQIQ